MSGKQKRDICYWNCTDRGHLDGEVTGLLPSEAHLFSLGDSFFPFQGYSVTSWVPITWRSTSRESLPLLEVLFFVLSHGSTVGSRERSRKPLEEKRWRRCWGMRTLWCQAHLKSSRKTQILLFNVLYTSTRLDLLLNSKQVFILYELQISYFFNHILGIAQHVFFHQVAIWYFQKSEGRDSVTRKHVLKSNTVEDLKLSL